MNKRDKYELANGLFWGLISAGVATVVVMVV